MIEPGLRPTDRVLLVLGASAGLFGVTLSAAAAHLDSPTTLDTAARFLLVHAPVLVGLGALVGAGLVSRGAGRLAGIAFALGLALFCGDLARRGLQGLALFRFAAPAGGFLLIGAWALLAVAVVWPVRRP